jgi:hypothetical protein
MPVAVMGAVGTEADPSPVAHMRAAVESGHPGHRPVGPDPEPSAAGRVQMRRCSCETCSSFACLISLFDRLPSPRGRYCANRTRPEIWRRLVGNNFMTTGKILELGRGLATFISVLLARAGRGKPGARGVALPAAPAGREVIGRGPDVLYVRFQREGQLISVPPHLPRLLPGLARWTSAPAPTADSI